MASVEELTKKYGKKIARYKTRGREPVRSYQINSAKKQDSVQNQDSVQKQDSVYDKEPKNKKSTKRISLSEDFIDMVISDLTLREIKVLFCLIKSKKRDSNEITISASEISKQVNIQVNHIRVTMKSLANKGIVFKRNGAEKNIITLGFL